MKVWIAKRIRPYINFHGSYFQLCDGTKILKILQQSYDIKNMSIQNISFGTINPSFVMTTSFSGLLSCIFCDVYSGLKKSILNILQSSPALFPIVLFETSKKDDNKSIPIPYSLLKFARQNAHIMEAAQILDFVLVMSIFCFRDNFSNMCRQIPSSSFVRFSLAKSDIKFLTSFIFIFFFSASIFH